MYIYPLHLAVWTWLWRVTLNDRAVFDRIWHLPFMKAVLGWRASDPADLAIIANRHIGEYSGSWLQVITTGQCTIGRRLRWP